MSASNPVSKLLQSLLGRGFETRDALPLVKKLIEGKIMSLDGIENESQLPTSIPLKIRRKMLPKKKAKASSPTKKRKVEPISIPSVTVRPDRILVNRSPILSLWAAIVARKLFQLTFTEAMSIGAAIAAETAKGKGVTLGIYQKEETKTDPEEAEREFELLGQSIRATTTDEGIRAIDHEGNIQNPYSTWKNIQKKFGEALGHVCHEFQSAVEQAGSNESLKASAYQFYVHVRPDIPQGTKGWGAHGSLEMARVSSFYTDNKEEAT